VSPIEPETSTAREAGVTLVIPAYNEEHGIGEVVTRLIAMAPSIAPHVEIVVVDDGSRDRTAEVAAHVAGGSAGVVRVIRNETNRGYGFSLKRGIAEAKHGIVVITDADGTYPIERIAELVERVRGGAAMAVGARSLTSMGVPFTRKPAKWTLNALAAFLAGRRIPDLNSGLRAMRKSLVTRFEPILPDGFSFTTTITLASLTNGYAVDFVPIDYARRTGKSKIRPIRDTVNFFTLVVRTVLYFRPLKVFVPLALALFAFATPVIWHDIKANVLQPSNLAPLGDVSIGLCLAAVQVLVVGFLADLASVSLRPTQLVPSRASRSKLYTSPLAFFLAATAISLLGAVFLHLRDRYGFLRGPDAKPRPLMPKTLALYVTTLQFFSAGLLADLLQRRGRLK
jgi:glycosyltransferase involved in cell wall biosynthesis